MGLKQTRDGTMFVKFKTPLLCALCIFLSGGLGSYKSFQIHQDQLLSNGVSQSQSLSHLMGQNMEQKIQQMEDAVSYLDQSTVESLKRLGSRYFAYAYQNKGEWAFKWKSLGGPGKQGILQEIALLPYGQFKQTRRYWEKSKKGDLIMVSPAALGKSFQLKEGFLVFGIRADFFHSLNSPQASYTLLTDKGESLFGKLPQGISPHLGKVEQERAFHRGLLTQAGRLPLTTEVFSQKAHLWLLRTQDLPHRGFMASSFFSYFLLISLFSLLVMGLLWTRFRVRQTQNTEESIEAQIMEAGITAEERAEAQNPQKPSLLPPERESTPTERIEIKEEDTDMDMIPGVGALQPEALQKDAEDAEEKGETKEEGAEKEEKEKNEISFEEVTKFFQLKNLGFQEPEPLPSSSSQAQREEETKTKKGEESPLSSKGREISEFNSEGFKIKIRSPKKRGDDVNR